MGLCVTAYKNLRLIRNHIFDRDDLQLDFNHWIPSCYDSGCTAEWYPIKQNVIYEWSEAYIFNAGDQYSHAIWIENLKKFKGQNIFRELTSLSAHHGVIGTKTAILINDDFNRYNDEVLAFSESLKPSTQILFLDSYHHWKKALALAAENGAIEYRQI